MNKHRFGLGMRCVECDADYYGVLDGLAPQVCGSSPSPLQVAVDEINALAQERGALIERLLAERDDLLEALHQRETQLRDCLDHDRNGFYDDSPVAASGPEGRAEATPTAERPLTVTEATTETNLKEQP